MLLGKTNKTNEKNPKKLILLRNSRSFVLQNSRAALEMFPWREAALGSSPAWNSSMQRAPSSEKGIPAPRTAQSPRGASWSQGREPQSPKRNSRAWEENPRAQKGNPSLGRESQSPKRNPRAQKGNSRVWEGNPRALKGIPESGRESHTLRRTAWSGLGDPSS